MGQVSFTLRVVAKVIPVHYEGEPQVSLGGLLCLNVLFVLMYIAWVLSLTLQKCSSLKLHGKKKCHVTKYLSNDLFFKTYFSVNKTDKTFSPSCRTSLFELNEVLKMQSSRISRATAK